METQTDLNVGVGTKEIKSLEPKCVRIVSVGTEPVKFGNDENTKIMCLCLHPAKQEPISISTVKYESKTKLKVSGLWLTRDEDKKVQKGSVLSILMSKVGANTIKELEGKDINTCLDDKGYLAFKCY